MSAHSCAPLAMLAVAVTLGASMAFNPSFAASPAGAPAAPEMRSALCGPVIVGGAKEAHGSQGRLFLPVYSAIRYLHDDRFAVAVTISLRNPNPTQPLHISSALLFGDQGEPLKDFVSTGSQVIPPLGAIEMFLRNVDFPQHTGASMVIAWSGPTGTIAPVAESVMIGSKGSQGFAFNSRASELGACP